jgi:hypothetical protein
MLRKIRQVFIEKRLHGDGGWTFIEAVYSVVLLSVVFLGFTITIMSFREWLNRSWAIRVVDQYANDVMTHIEGFLQMGGSIAPNPPKNGLGSFRIYVMNLNQYPIYIVDSTAYNFSAHPKNGIFIGVGNTASEEFYAYRTGGDEVFPPPGWHKEHEITITDFRFVPWNDALLTEDFNEAMPQIILNLEYKRFHKVDTKRGERIREYTLEKEYRVSTYMKNTLMKRD